MCIRRKMGFVMIIIGLALMAGCRTVEPTATRVPPTDTLAPRATATSTPPTATETPVATVTPTPLKPMSTPETSLISSGGVIAFTSYGDDHVGSIYVMDVQAILQGADDSDPQLLIENAGSGVWSPDGAKMAYRSREDGRDALYVLDLDSGETRKLTDATHLYPSSWSPDGSRIAFCAKQGGEWDIYAINSDGSDVQQLTDHPAEDISPAWSPDGTQIVFCSMRAGNPEIFVMEADGSSPRNLTQNDAIDNSPNWSPDGAQIVFHSNLAGNSDIYVMNSDGSALQQLTVNSAEDWRADWSPDGNWISFLSYRNPDGDSEVYVLDLSGGTEAEGNRPQRLTHSPAHEENPTWQPAAPAQEPEAISPDTVDMIELLYTIHGHDGRIYGLDFSSDGTLLASGSHDGTIRLWEVGSWQEKGVFDQRGEWTVFFAPDDAHIATEDGTIWNITSGEKVQSLDARQFHVTFSSDGAWMALAGYNSPIDVWDVETWQVVQTLEGHTDRVFGLAFSPDGTLLASGSGLGPSDVSDFVVKVWDIASGAEVHALKGHSGDIHAVAFSPDGTLVASASTDYTVRLWDVQSGELVHTLRHRDGLYDVTFSPDGSLLASAGCDRTVKLWDVASGRLVRSLSHGDEVMAVVFAPDGTLLASGGYDNQVYLWGVPR